MLHVQTAVDCTDRRLSDSGAESVGLVVNTGGLDRGVAAVCFS